jgi:hypothetical protein
MTTPERFRSYASDLLAMAATARGNGDDDYADELTAKANEFLGWAEQAERPTAAVPPPSRPAPPHTKK